ncbi:3'-5' exoribonuclease [Clostridium perfringens]|nr:3'-5' exoribonuclease [Clostridium perfringens]MDZ4992873.1 DNA polymerase III subunit epsilon [Clostridium perfringens]
MDFVAIDFETANEKRNSACSIGLTIVKNNKIVEEKYFLIKPCEMRFQPMNIWIHGIRPEDVEKEKTFDEIWEEIKDYIDGNLVIAHNAAFDISVLRKTLDFYSIPYPDFEYACTVVMAKNYYKNLPNHKLGTVSEALGFEFSHHHAGEDAKACANILINICKDLEISSVEELSDKLAIRIGAVYDKGYKPSGKKGECRYLSNLKLKENKKEGKFSLRCKNVVFTGPLSSMSRGEAIGNVIRCGGFVSSSVSKKTNYLITGIKGLEKLKESEKSIKLKKAEKLIKENFDIKIIGEEEFLSIIE